LIYRLAEGAFGQVQPHDAGRTTWDDFRPPDRLLQPTPLTNKLLHHILTRPVIRLGGKVRHQPMPQYGLRHLLDVLEVRHGPAVDGGAGLGAQHQIL